MEKSIVAFARNLKHYITVLERFTDKRKMTLNTDKSKIMVFKKEGKKRKLFGNGRVITY